MSTTQRSTQYSIYQVLNSIKLAIAKKLKGTGNINVPTLKELRAQLDRTISFFQDRDLHERLWPALQTYLGQIEDEVLRNYMGLILDPRELSNERIYAQFPLLRYTEHRELWSYGEDKLRELRNSLEIRDFREGFTEDAPLYWGIDSLLQGIYQVNKAEGKTTQQIFESIYSDFFYNIKVPIEPIHLKCFDLIFPCSDFSNKNFILVFGSYCLRIIMLFHDNPEIIMDQVSKLNDLAKIIGFSDYHNSHHLGKLVYFVCMGVSLIDTSTAISDDELFSEKLLRTLRNFIENIDPIDALPFVLHITNNIFLRSAFRDTVKFDIWRTVIVQVFDTLSAKQMHHFQAEDEVVLKVRDLHRLWYVFRATRNASMSFEDTIKRLNLNDLDILTKGIRLLRDILEYQRCILMGTPEDVQRFVLELDNFVKRNVSVGSPNRRSLESVLNTIKRELGITSVAPSGAKPSAKPKAKEHKPTPRLQAISNAATRASGPAAAAAAADDALPMSEFRPRAAQQKKQSERAHALPQIEFDDSACRLTFEAESSAREARLARHQEALDRKAITTSDAGSAASAERSGRAGRRHAAAKIPAGETPATTSMLFTRSPVMHRRAPGSSETLLNVDIYGFPSWLYCSEDIMANESLRRVVNAIVIAGDTTREQIGRLSEKQTYELRVIGAGQDVRAIGVLYKLPKAEVTSIFGENRPTCFYIFATVTSHAQLNDNIKIATMRGAEILRRIRFGYFSENVTTEEYAAAQER